MIYVYHDRIFHMNSTHSGGDNLIWKDEYSVHVKILDDQHKHLFDLTNNLRHLLRSNTTDAEIAELVTAILSAKSEHFATEERYFHEFSFEGTKEHEGLHQQFTNRIEELTRASQGNIKKLASSLVDFLALWFVGHLMSVDQKYTECFKEHGLS
jgi:hemerythrin